ncbi:Alpha-L-arabinofuranosidase 1 [Nymphaea thermarum]|nr:Alpha-L-arabinofuranosidase 1 [Nymphaea thermarum]
MLAIGLAPAWFKPLSHGYDTGTGMAGYCIDRIGVRLKIKITGLDSKDLSSSGSSKTIMTSNNLMDENSFAHPEKALEDPAFQREDDHG